MSTETWTGTDNDPWPTGWTVSAGGDQTIQSDKGRMIGDPFAAFSSAIWTTPDPGDGNFDLVVTAHAVSGAGDIRVGVGAATNEWSTPNNGYTLKLTVDNTGAFTYGALKRHSSATETELTFDYLAAITPGVDGWTLRFKRTADLLQARVWAAGDTEPGTWTLEHTDLAPLAGDFYPWLGVEAAGFTVDYDDLDYTTGAPPTAEDYITLPAGETTWDFTASNPKATAAVVAQFASTDTTQVSEHDTVYVTWASSVDTTFTLNASTARAWDRTVRVRY